MIEFFMGRRTDIDCAKGLAILLVVFGHIVARADPIGVYWYEPLRRAVYAFHMPFFLYLSGLAATISGAAFAPPSAWRQLALARAKRLLRPFFTLGFCIVLGKLAAGHFMFVDNQPSGLRNGLSALIWHTANSPAISIWYLFVLFVLSLAVPILVWVDSGRLRILLAICLLLYCLPLPAYIYADHIGRYAVFFACGVWAGTQGNDWTAFIDRSWPWLAAIFAVFLVFIILFGATWPPVLELLPVGVISMPVLHGLVRNSNANLPEAFLWLGRYSFMIYLFNTLFIGLAKGVLLHIVDWNGAHFLPFAITLMAAGTLGQWR